MCTPANNKRHPRDTAQQEENIKLVGTGLALYCWGVRLRTFPPRAAVRLELSRPRTRAFLTDQASTVRLVLLLCLSTSPRATQNYSIHLNRPTRGVFLSVVGG